jgi:hypothetical protein
MHVIDYGHMRDGVLYHGTMSDMDGAPKATWIYEEGGRKVTRDQPIDEERFRALWNGIAGLDVFRRHMVRGPDQPIDPAGYHVIGIAFQQQGQHGQCLFLVPDAEVDPEFVQWLQMLEPPQGSA